MLCLVGGFSIHLFCGCLYLWGNIEGYVVSHFHYGPEGTTGKGDSHVTPKSAAIVLPIMFWFQFPFNGVGAYFAQTQSPKLLITIGSVLMLGSIFFASFVTNWMAFLSLYAVVYPIGIGISYFPAMICGWEYFPERKGFVSGLILCGFGLGAFVFGFISTALANPKNEKPGDDKFFPRDVADNVPKMLQVCVAIWAVLCVISVVTVSRDPNLKKMQYLPKSSQGLQENRDSTLTAQVSNQIEEEPIGIKEGILTWRAAHVSVLLLFGLFYPLYIASVYKPIADDVLSDSVLTAAGAIGGVCNGTSRLIWASLMDKYGFKPVYGCLMTIQLVISASIYSVRTYADLYPIWVGLSYFCEGGHFSLFATLSV